MTQDERRQSTPKSGQWLPLGQIISVLFYTIPIIFAAYFAPYLFQILWNTDYYSMKSQITETAEPISQAFMEIWQYIYSNINLVCYTVGICVITFSILLQRPDARVYIVDYKVFKGPMRLEGTYELFRKGHAAIKSLSSQSYDFLERVLYRSGVGEKAYFPQTMLDAVTSASEPQPNTTLAREEFAMVVYPIVEDLLNSTGISPRKIDILVVNCSLFNPTPSLCSMIINRFSLKSDIQSLNIAGMGCSAGLLAIEQARQMLQLKPNSYALVVSTENITQNWYLGNRRSMLIPNALFRMGGAAILLTNKRTEWFRAKYEVEPVVRTMQADDAGQQAVYQREDEDGVLGVQLNRELTTVAGKVLQKNVATFARQVLPWSEQLAFAAVKIGKVLGLTKENYCPNFKRAFEHFCIHTGGRAVIEAMEKNLNLPEKRIEPSKASLWRFGNVSSASLWYTLAYIESYQGVKRGDRVWQLGFGSGFKVNSTKLTAIRTSNKMHEAWDDWDKDRELEKMREVYKLTFG